MAATATESSSSCTWGGVCKGIARIAMVVVVGVAIGYGAWYAADAMKWTDTAKTIAQVGTGLVAGFTGVTTTIGNGLSSLVGLGGDAAGSLTGVSVPTEQLANAPQLDVAALFNKDYVDVTTAFADSHSKWNAYVDQLKGAGLYDKISDLPAFQKIQTFFDANNTAGFVGQVPANLPQTLDGLKTEIGDMNRLIAQVSDKTGHTLNGIADIAKGENVTAAKLKALSETGNAFKESMAKTATEAAGLDQLYKAKVLGGAASSTTALATAAGVGAAGTAAVAYVAGGSKDRGEPVGKFTQREQLRQAAYAEALGEGQGAPARG